MGKTADFSGWATRYNIKCADGRTIKPGSFDDCDGKTVPLMWDHKHDSQFNVLGNALLHSRKEGMYAECTFNETPQGKNARELVKNGDITHLSIYANHLKQTGGDVIHGLIREVSLVMAGANPGAYIDNVVIAHSEDGIIEAEEAIIFTDVEIIHSDDNNNSDSIEHSDIPAEDKTAEESKEPKAEESESELEHSDDKENKDMGAENDETVEDVLNTLNEKQKAAVAFVCGKIAEDAKNDKGEDDMAHHNAFDQDAAPVMHRLTKEEQAAIIADMKKYGTLKESFLAHKEELGIEDVIMHADDHGIEYSTGDQTYMVNDPSFLFPEARALNNPPAWIKRDTGWVSSVIGGTKHVPFSRIKSVFADITEDEARAKGYIKGHVKKEEVFTLLKRTTTPQTVYKKQKMDRDDIIDITDFDVVAWIRGEMRIMLDEEIARAILIGDGRPSVSDDKISEDHIRPIYTDADLFTIKQFVEYAANASDDDKAKAYIRAAVKARKNYKGSGNPVFYTTEDVLTDMLLLEDNMGHRLYKSEAELATAMRVSKIVTVQVMEGVQRTVDNVTRDLVGIIVNLGDYTVGADKGGAISMFDDFDIDRNQEKYLIETRCSGALTVPYSAIVIESAQEA